MSLDQILDAHASTLEARIASLSKIDRARLQRATSLSPDQHVAFSTALGRALLGGIIDGDDARSLGATLERWEERSLATRVAVMSALRAILVSVTPGAALGLSRSGQQRRVP